MLEVSYTQINRQNLCLKRCIRDFMAGPGLNRLNTSLPTTSKCCVRTIYICFFVCFFFHLCLSALSQYFVNETYPDIKDVLFPLMPGTYSQGHITSLIQRNIIQSKNRM